MQGYFEVHGGLDGLSIYLDDWCRNTALGIGQSLVLGSFGEST